MPALPASQRSRWLFGPVPDLFLGCGLAYLLVFVLLVVAGKEVQTLVPVGLLVMLSLLAGTPHYGATILRVYERSEDRRAYRIFALWATLVIAAAFTVGVYDVMVASVLFTIYVTWNAWHYTGQNYGIALMFLGRRGVQVRPLEKRIVYASFVLSYVLIVLALFGGDAGGGYAPQTGDRTALVTFLPIGLPPGIVGPATALVAAAYLGALAGAGVLLGRRTAWRDLGPSALLVLVQAVWFAVPQIARVSGIFQSAAPLAADYAQYAFFWIAYAHAIQYLWITTYYATARDPQLGRFKFYWKSVLAGSVVWGVPALVFAPRWLGSLPNQGGLVLLVAAAVNIHHFVLDGAIWKLRDGRIARVLIRSERAAAPAVAPRSAVFRPLVWGVGALCAAVFVFDTWETYFGFAAAYARRDTERVHTAVERLEWIGRDGAEMHYVAAQMLAVDQRVPEAMRHLQRSVETGPTARAWTGIGELHEWRSEWREAIEAYDAALALTPDHVPALYRSGLVLYRLGQPAQAKERLARASALDPTNREVAEALRVASLNSTS